MPSLGVRRAVVIGVSSLTTALALVPGGSAVAASSPAAATARPTMQVSTRVQPRSQGTVSLSRPAKASPNISQVPNEHYIVTDPDNNSQFTPGGSGKGAARLAVSADRAVVHSPSPGTVGFTGITGREQALVNNGGDLEPPDQGLCSDGTTTLEFVNNALEAYGTAGDVRGGPYASPSLFGLDPSTFMADPRCYYDAPTKRWFLAEFDIGSTDANGQETVPSVQYVAVSNTSDPLGTYHVYSIDTTDSTVSGCPCFGDYDQIGADANGFYISTNEFGLSSGAFNGSLIYAISKSGLEQSGGLGSPAPYMVTYRLLNDQFGQPYHVAPAQTPPGGAYAPNREYFVESNSDANYDNHLVVYTLDGTNRLRTGGVPFASSTYIDSEKYAFPPNAVQPAGPLPLARAAGDPRGTLQADFNAIQEVTYTAGRLFAELDTAAANHKDGVGWFVLQPTATGSTTSVSMLHQGYVTNPDVSLLYPDIAVDSTGRGYLLFSVSGIHQYPSAANIPFTASGPVGSIRIAAEGAAPEDGFTCYAAFVGPGYGGCRWGDYSMGVAAGGRIFMATEYISSAPRDYYTNWATYVWSAPTP